MHVSRDCRDLAPTLSETNPQSNEMLAAMSFNIHRKAKKAPLGTQTGSGKPHEDGRLDLQEETMWTGLSMSELIRIPAESGINSPAD